MQSPPSTPAPAGLDLMESTDVGDGVLPSREVVRRSGEHIGPYRIEKTIGAGAMGVVYSAIDPETDRRVAVKLMHPRGYYEREGSTTSRRTDAWLRNEARALSRLSHPNVVGVHGVGTERGRPYMAMEFVEGRTLAAWLAEADHGWEETLHVCLQAARGLAAAHRAGVMHGDFKPDNVMVATDGRVLVMDFGLSRSMSRQARASTETAIPAITDELLDATDEETQRHPAVADGLDVGSVYDGQLEDDEVSGLHDPFELADDDDDDDTASEDPDRSRSGDRLRRRPGTPAYMAPELLAGVGGDARSDQFSLCVTMYKSLFGQRPYGGRTPSEIAFKVARSDLRLSPNGHDAPVWVHAAITRGLSIEPTDRWRSVETLIRVLQAGMRQRARRRLWIAIAASMAALAVIVALGVLAS